MRVLLASTWVAAALIGAMMIGAAAGLVPHAAREIGEQLAGALEEVQRHSGSSVRIVLEIRPRGEAPKGPPA